MQEEKETLFIADDEASIREGLKVIVDWDQLGFRLCGEAANGDDALSKILALRPSLVLLDVKMPGMHGTEIIRRAREAGFMGKCIILSGYSDFKYAQEAIKSGVSYYLTKPLDEEELYQVVSEIKELIDHEKQQSSHIVDLKNKAKNMILYELITGTISTPLSEADKEHYHLTTDVYQIVICEDFHTRSAVAPYTFAELLKVTNKENNTFEHLEVDNKDMVLLKGSHGQYRLMDFLEHLEEQPLQSGSPMASMFLTYGRPVTSVEDIHLSYEDALALLNRRFFCAQEQHALGYENLPGIIRKITDISQSGSLTFGEDTAFDFANRIAGYIQSFNRKMVVAILQELEDVCTRVSEDINTIKLFLTDVYLQVKEKINSTYTSAEIPFETNSAVIDFITNQNYLYEIIRFLSKQFEMIMNATGNPSRDTILDDVLFYIDHNFKNNIKLETIAPLFGYNSAYLGKIFSKTVGESFNTYLDHKRIEYSKQLLMENKLKVYEIAEQAGYKNVDYFHKKFKKYVGVSPAEFRK
ncbi:MAG: response regulator [Lachnospiraceae bacterium]|nr:response regulator [Lachnospiraceae bacterium]